MGKLSKFDSSNSKIANFKKNENFLPFGYYCGYKTTHCQEYSFLDYDRQWMRHQPTKNIMNWSSSPVQTQLPYRTKSFVGIYGQEIRDCQIRKC